MRIIAGRWRRRLLQAPAGAATRPTADRVRETLFSMLASRLGSFEGLRVADLFAGSGAMGIEALSRGAGFAAFVETDPAALAAIRTNIAALGASGSADIISGSALALPAATPFDLVFADPPYGKGFGRRAVSSVEQAGWLAAGGWLCVETGRSEQLGTLPFELEADRTVGAARLWLLRRT